MEIIKELAKYEARSMHGQLPVTWDKAKGNYVYDKKGNKYLDFTSGIFVTNCGHSAIGKALIKQCKQNLIFSYTFPTEIRLKFLKKLIETTPKFCEKAFLMSSGTEATECAVKLMKMHGKTIADHKRRIVSFRGAMHGRTFFAERLSDGGSAQIICLPYPESEDDFKEHLKELDNVSSIAGVIIESYQGWSARFMPKKYVQELVYWARTYGIPVCFDEIQSGFWRTGKQFGYEHYEVEPDLICVGKGLGGGIPISAVIGKASLLDLPDVGSMSSTFSANPLCCAGALENLKILDKLDKQVIMDKGALLSSYLSLVLRPMLNSKLIKQINCTGLVAGIIFDNTEIANKVIIQAKELGVLYVKTGRESIKLGPPLTITEDELKLGVVTLDQAIRKVCFS